MSVTVSEDTKQIMVSVIVLTYNHERYIEQALDNILSQKTEFSYEILVGDDASTDRTCEILKEYARRWPDKFRLFLREKNIGASRNAYELLMAARGKYLATCEGDDFWCDCEKLQIQVSYLEEHPEVVGCVHRQLVVDEEGKPRKNQRLDWVRQKPVFTLDDFQGIYLPGQYATFVRRNVFLKRSDDYELIYNGHGMVADRSTMLLYLLEGDIILIDRVMSCYRKIIRKDGENLTNVVFRNNKDRVKEELNLLRRMEEHLSKVKGGTVRFEERRKSLFCEGILQWLRGAGRDNLRVAVEIWREREVHKFYWCYFWGWLVCRCLKKIEDRLILVD